jgi:hypothetical protein
MLAGSGLGTMRVDSMPERMPLRRRLIFGSIAVAVSLAIAGAGLLAADLYLHRKYEGVSAVNIWGYRGPAVGDKAPGERRIAVLGGSAAFGYGVTWTEAFPFYLEQLLNGSSARGRSYRVINLAYNAESAASFLPTLEDYRYLDYDLAILYEGYNDLIERPKTAPYRRESAVFRATGYMPLLPMVLREKYFDWRYAGDIDKGYRDAAAVVTVFRPADDAAVAAARQSLTSQLGAWSGAAAADRSCGAAWARYCRAVLDAVRAGRAQGTLILVASQPYISDRHVEQQAGLRHAIAAAFGGDAGVGYVDLGRAIDLRDPAMAYDGMHLTHTGNRAIAGAFLPAVLRMIAVLDGSSGES